MEIHDVAPGGLGQQSVTSRGAFLKDRGCVEVQRRRCRPASECFIEDALCEWHALAYQSEMEEHDGNAILNRFVDALREVATSLERAVEGANGRPSSALTTSSRRFWQ